MARRLLVLALAAVALSLSMAACDEEGESRERNDTAPSVAKYKMKPQSEYHETLLEFRAAAAAGETYDVYGYAEYFPKSQRAALHAFCFVADRMLKDGEAGGFSDVAYLTGRITRKAEADLKTEFDIVARRQVRKAIRKLDAVLNLGSLDNDLAGRYVKACY